MSADVSTNNWALRESLKKKEEEETKTVVWPTVLRRYFLGFKDHEARVGTEPRAKLAFCGVRKQTLTHDFVPYSGSHETEREGGRRGALVFARFSQRCAGISAASQPDGQRKRARSAIHLLRTAPIGRKAGQHGSPLLCRNPHSNQRSFGIYTTLR